MDTIPPSLDEKRQFRNALLETVKIHEVTNVAKKHGINCKVAISQALYQEIYPYAEDANHGVNWEELLYDMLKIFKKEFKHSGKEYGEFAICTKTYIKEIYDYDKIITFVDGKPRDKRIEIFVSWIPDENLRPSMIFGLKSAKFF